MKTEYFDCCCSAPDHTLRFMYDTTEFNEGAELPTIYTEVMMSHYLPWHKRIWVAIKYLFGMDTPDHFGCWELDSKDTDRMIDMLTKFKETENKYMEQKESYMNKASEELYSFAGYEQHSKDD